MKTSDQRKNTQEDEQFFTTEYVKADLKGRSIRAGAVTLTGQGVRFFLLMGSTAVLARLLTPQDYGLIAMVAAFTNLVKMFKDMGLSTATIQKAEINRGQISTLFWINVLLSVGVMLVVAALAPAIAWFYAEPRLIWITLALAGAFIFGGLTVQHQALLRRQMRFGSLALIQVVSMLAGIITAIIAAFYGAGYWSLVLMQLATGAINAFGVWVACDWRPNLPVRRSGVRGMLKFGGHVTGFKFLNYFSVNADHILVGKFIGADALGLYAKAYSLVSMPIDQIKGPLDRVAMPVLSSLQNQPERYVKYYQRLIDIIASLSIPLTVYCVIETDFLIRTLLGQQWLGAVPVFRMLAIAELIQPVVSTLGLVLLSHGFSDRYFYLGLFSTIITVASYVAGLPFGIMGVASGYAVSRYVILIPSLLYCFRETHITVSLFMKTLASPMLSALLAAGCVILMKYHGTRDSLTSHIVYAGVFIMVYTSLSFCRKSVRETWRLFLNELPIVSRKNVGMG